jgi:hypothetical protein
LILTTLLASLLLAPTAFAAGSPQRLGKTVLLARPTRTSACVRGALPDRRCSPGAFYAGVTKAVLCSPAFQPSNIRAMTKQLKHAVEIAYGMAPRKYHRTLEIDYIVPLELGGANNLANLFPESQTADPGYLAKDRLELKLHDLVCAGKMTLTTARQSIAANWISLYRSVFGATP